MSIIQKLKSWITETRPQWAAPEVTKQRALETRRRKLSKTVEAFSREVVEAMNEAASDVGIRIDITDHDLTAEVLAPFMKSLEDAGYRVRIVPHDFKALRYYRELEITWA